MSDVLAVVRGDRFERYLRRNGLAAEPGTVCGWNNYPSKQPRMKHLERGGRLFLVTVRQPEEHLWLVALHQGMKEHGAGEWLSSQPNRIPITDITDLKLKLTFEPGQARLTSVPGSLGQSLQTPRFLTNADSAMLHERIGSSRAGVQPSPKRGDRPGKEISATEGVEIEAEAVRRSRDPVLRESCLKRDRYACQHCGFELRSVRRGAMASSMATILDVHHVVPLKDVVGPGETHLSDLLTLCPTCHRVAHAIQAQTAAKRVDLQLLKKHFPRSA